MKQPKITHNVCCCWKCMKYRSQEVKKWAKRFYAKKIRRAFKKLINDDRK